QARGSGALAREEVAWPVNTEGDPGAAAPAGAAQELCVCRRFASESFSFVLSFVRPGHSRSWNGVVSLAYPRHPCRTYACTAHSTGGFGAMAATLFGNAPYRSLTDPRDRVLG